MKKSEEKNQGKKKLVGTLDLTPSWVSLVQLFLEWIQSGTSEQHQHASESIMQMAKIADAYRENQSLFEASGDMYEALKKVNIELCNIPHEDSKTMRVKMGIVKAVDEALAKASGKK